MLGKCSTTLPAGCSAALNLWFGQQLYGSPTTLLWLQACGTGSVLLFQEAQQSFVTLCLLQIQSPTSEGPMILMRLT